MQSESVIFPNLFHFFKGFVCLVFVFVLLVCLFWSCWDPMKFHVNFRMSFSIPPKHIVGILIGIALNLRITLGNVDIVTILKLHIMNPNVFSFIYVFFNFFQQYLRFSVCKSFRFLVNFISKYLILFYPIVNEMILLNFFFRLPCYYVKLQLTYEYWFFILLFCWFCLF